MDLMIILIFALIFSVILFYLLRALIQMNKEIKSIKDKINNVYCDIDNLIANMDKKEINNEVSRTRIELMMLIKNFPENKENINRLAYKYFAELNGDSYMYELYLNWINENNESISGWFKKRMEEEYHNNF